MRMRDAVKWFSIGVAIVLALWVSAPFGAGKGGGDTGSSVTDEEAKSAVDFHNEKRKEVGVPEVTWSNELATFAQEWADHIAETGDVKHRPGEGDFAQKYGENLAWGSGAFTVAKAGQGWYSEKKAYDSGKQSLPEDLNDIGHYTQMVWKSTKKIGVGKAVIQKGEYKGWTIVVCNYDPPGNYGGEKPF